MVSKEALKDSRSRSSTPHRTIPIVLGPKRNAADTLVKIPDVAGR